MSKENPKVNQMELPLKKDVDLDKHRKYSMLVDQFMRVLEQEGYRVEFPAYPVIRLCGVQEGELYFAIRCKVQKG